MVLISRTFDIQDINKSAFSSVQLSNASNGGILLFLSAEWVGDLRDASDNYIDHTIFIIGSEGSSAAGRSIFSASAQSLLPVPAGGSFIWEHPYKQEIEAVSGHLDKLKAPTGTKGDKIPGMFKSSAYIHALLESTQTSVTDKHDLRIQASIFEFE